MKLTHNQSAGLSSQEVALIAFGRSVNPISTRGGADYVNQIIPDTDIPGFKDLETVNGVQRNPKIHLYLWKTSFSFLFD